MNLAKEFEKVLSQSRCQALDQQLPDIDDEQEDIDDDSEEKIIRDELVESVSRTFPRIFLVKCAVHTFQLAVNGFISEFTDVISQCRAIVNKLRTQVWLILLKERSLNKPIVDVATRWGSTYKMISYCLTNRQFIQEFEKSEACFKLSSGD